MSTFAVIETGGKQYKVKKGDKIRVEKLTPEKGGKVVFKQVLLAVDGANLKVGTPFVSDATVLGKVVREARGERKIVFRYHSKTRYRKFKTHRQPFTEIEITRI